jgi:hypothetical protein
MSTNQEPAHPFKGFFLLLIAGGGLLWLTSFVSAILPWGETITIGDNSFTVKWWVYVFPVAFLLTILIRAMDAVAKGKLFDLLGKVIAFGFPSFGESLQILRLWYENPEEQRSNYWSGEHLDRKHIFSKWMIAEIVPKYENNVYAFAYWGAAILIVLVGLRGIQFMTREDPSLLIAGLELEFLLILLLGTLMFYKPEEYTPHPSPNGEVSAEDLDHLSKTVEELQEKVSALQSQLKSLKEKP